MGAHVVDDADAYIIKLAKWSRPNSKVISDINAHISYKTFTQANWLASEQTGMQAFRPIDEAKVVKEDEENMSLSSI